MRLVALLTSLENSSEDFMYLVQECSKFLFIVLGKLYTFNVIFFLFIHEQIQLKFIQLSGCAGHCGPARVLQMY